MMIDENKAVLASASFYRQGWFFNEEYSGLPEKIKKEIHVLCAALAQEARCIILMGFYKEDGTFFIQYMAPEEDLEFDEIGARLAVDKAQKENEELFKSLSLWYKTFIIAGVSK